jgi:hypothetical protein
MFVFGHIGLGRALIGRWRHTLPSLPLTLGMLLPDIIDKPLYYARLWPFFSCTRTLGHTGVFLLLLLLSGYWTRRPSLIALSIGASTHVGLDLCLDLINHTSPSPSWIALTWPVLNTSFATFYFTFSEHIARLWATTSVVVAEAGGLFLLGREAMSFRRGQLAAKPSRRFF